MHALVTCGYMWLHALDVVGYSALVCLLHGLVACDCIVGYSALVGRILCIGRQDGFQLDNGGVHNCVAKQDSFQLELCRMTYRACTALMAI